ncbi:hypothetical protein ACPA0F_18375 [Solibacillus silvestris]
MNTSKPKSKSELMQWFAENSMTSLHCAISYMRKDGNETPTRESLLKDVEKVITRVSGGGVYLKTIKSDPSSGQGMDYVKLADIRESWLSIESVDEENFLFTEEYFAIFVIEELKLEQQSSIKVLLYQYGNAMKDRPAVRGVLNCTVTDSFYDAALNKLTLDELEYCIQQDKRKTSLAKLERRLKILKSAGDYKVN